MDIEDLKPVPGRCYPEPKIEFGSVEKDSYLKKCSKVYIKSYGCPHNYSDGEYMGGNFNA